MSMFQQKNNQPDDFSSLTTRRNFLYLCTAAAIGSFVGGCKQKPVYTVVDPLTFMESFHKTRLREISFSKKGYKPLSEGFKIGLAQIISMQKEVATQIKKNGVSEKALNLDEIYSHGWAVLKRISDLRVPPTNYSPSAYHKYILELLPIIALQYGLLTLPGYKISQVSNDKSEVSRIEPTVTFLQLDLPQHETITLNQISFKRAIVPVLGNCEGTLDSGDSGQDSNQVFSHGAISTFGHVFLHSRKMRELRTTINNEISELQSQILPFNIAEKVIIAENDNKAKTQRLRQIAYAKAINNAKDSVSDSRRFLRHMIYDRQDFYLADVERGFSRNVFPPPTSTTTTSLRYYELNHDTHLELSVMAQSLAAKDTALSLALLLREYCQGQPPLSPYNRAANITVDLAIAEILKDPQSFGFQIKTSSKLSKQEQALLHLADCAQKPELLKRLSTIISQRQVDILCEELVPLQSIGNSN